MRAPTIFFLSRFFSLALIFSGCSFPHKRPHFGAPCRILPDSTTGNGLALSVKPARTSVTAGETLTFRVTIKNVSKETFAISKPPSFGSGFTLRYMSGRIVQNNTASMIIDPVWPPNAHDFVRLRPGECFSSKTDRKSTRLNSSHRL